MHLFFTFIAINNYYAVIIVAIVIALTVFVFSKMARTHRAEFKHHKCCLKHKKPHVVIGEKCRLWLD